MCKTTQLFDRPATSEEVREGKSPCAGVYLVCVHSCFFCVDGQTSAVLNGFNAVRADEKDKIRVQPWAATSHVPGRNTMQSARGGEWCGYGPSLSRWREEARGGEGGSASDAPSANNKARHTHTSRDIVSRTPSPLPPPSSFVGRSRKWWRFWRRMIRP